MAFEPYLGYRERPPRHINKTALAVSVQKNGCFSISEAAAEKINNTPYIYIERDLVTKQVRMRSVSSDHPRARLFKKDRKLRRYRLALKRLLQELNLVVSQAVTLEATFDGEWLNIDLKSIGSHKASSRAALQTRHRRTKRENLEEALRERRNKFQGEDEALASVNTCEVVPTDETTILQPEDPAPMPEVPVTPPMPTTPGFVQSTLLQLMEQSGGEYLRKELSSFLQQYPQIAPEDPE